jgi:hypothetical protein
MKDDILQRAMFAMPLSKESKNTGIMSGFDEEMDDMESEDEMTPMERTPQNPEIMMNTLRGDMRSTDARYMELAQMVGEEAAMETPPEVLAMLQEHFAMMQQPQGGIGALPQGGEMMPPPMPGQDPMAMPGQDPMAMQGAPMPMDQGPMMPPGGEGMPGPFPQGGAEQAPPTPDGMPPQQFAIGGLAAMGSAALTQAGRFAPAVARTLNQVGPAASRYAQSANAALGRMFMNPNVTQPMLGQARGPGGRFVSGGPGQVRGAGGKFTAEQSARGGELMYPTLTQGLNQGLTQLAAQYPKAGPVLSSAAAMLASLDGGPEAEPDRTGRQAIGYEVPVMAPASGARDGRGFIDERYYENVPGMSRGEAKAEAEATAATAATAAEQSGYDLPLAGNDPNEAPYNGEGRSAAEELAKVTGEQPKKLSKIDRIRASRDEYAPLFKELMGDNKADMKTNALLMLADAGFKFAGATEPTMAMSLAKSLEGIPKGLATLAAQAKDRGLKIDTAALTQAIGDVNAEDAQEHAMQMKIAEYRGKLLVEQAKQKGNKLVDLGAGLMRQETSNGSFVPGSHEVDQAHPTLASMRNSRYTVTSNNPFAIDNGPAATTLVTDVKAREKLLGAVSITDEIMLELDNIQRQAGKAYGPGAFISDVTNNLLVPLGSPIILPNEKLEGVKAAITSSRNALLGQLARAQEDGKISNQDKERIEEELKAFADPTAFFKDSQTAAAAIQGLRTNTINRRQRLMTQLGAVDRDYVLTIPPTGTSNNPFDLGGDLDQRNKMLTFLQSTAGKYNDQNAVINIINAAGKRDTITIAQLNALSR